MPSTRVLDPATSHLAAATITVPDLTRTQARILALITEMGGMSDEEIADHWEAMDFPPISPSGLRSRRAELVKQARLEDAGARTTTKGGNSTVVWGLPTPAVSTVHLPSQREAS